MNVYLDSSVLVKRYLVEQGTEAVEQLLADVAFSGTSLVSRAEVSAAFGKAARLKAITRDEGANALKQFRSHWSHLIRLRYRRNNGRPGGRTGLGARFARVRLDPFGFGLALAGGLERPGDICDL